MKTVKRAFDLILIITSALILISLSEHGLIEKYISFSLILVLIVTLFKTIFSNKIHTKWDS